MATINELLREGRVEEAKEAAVERLDKRARDPEALAAMAKIALYEGDVRVAETFLVRAEAVRATPETLLVRAAIAVEAGDTAHAMSSYRAVIALEQRAEAFYGMGRILLMRGDARSARDAFDRAIAIDEEPPAHHYYRGVALAELGDLERAAAAMQAVLERCKEFVPVYPALARILVALGRAEEAKSVLHVGLELAPEHPALLGALCELAMNANQLGEAMELAERARAATPEDPGAIAKSAAIAIAMAKPERAVAILASAGDVEHAALYALEGIARAAIKDVAAAERAYRRAMAMDPRDWRSPNDLGVLALEQSAAPEAVVFLQEAERRAPNELEVSLNLALAYGAQGDEKQAERYASRVLASRIAEDHPLRVRAKAILRGVLGAPPSSKKARRDVRVVDSAISPR